MSAHVTITFEPEITASSKGRVQWRVTQANGSGNPIGTSGKREDVLKVFHNSVKARIKEGYTVDAKVFTATGSLEEHATYTPDGKAKKHAVPAVTGESGFGRRCAVLTGTAETRREFRAQTTPARPAPAPKAPRTPKGTAAAVAAPPPPPPPSKAALVAIERAQSGGGGPASPPPAPPSAAPPAPPARTRGKAAPTAGGPERARRRRPTASFKAPTAADVPARTGAPPGGPEAQLGMFMKAYMERKQESAPAGS